MIILLSIIFIGIVLYELPSLIKKGYWYEIAFFFVFLLTAYIISLLLILRLLPADLSKGIEYVVRIFWQGVI